MGFLPKFWEEPHWMGRRQEPGMRGLRSAADLQSGPGAGLEGGSTWRSCDRGGGDPDSSPHSLPSSFSLCDVTKSRHRAFGAGSFVNIPRDSTGRDLTDSSAPSTFSLATILCVEADLPRSRGGPGAEGRQGRVRQRRRKDRSPSPHSAALDSGFLWLPPGD